MPNLERVKREIINGRLWKARDRLLGLFSTYPMSQEVLELLGEVYYKMGDLPEAGRYWYLTECNDEVAQEEAIQAFRERSGYEPDIILNQLPIRAPYNKYGPRAFERLQELATQQSKGNTNILDLSQDELEYMLEPSTWSIWRGRIIQSLILIFLLVPWLTGFFTLGIWITSFIAPSLGEYLLTHWFDLFDLVKVK